jgi:non-canonical (house-cleaning) NTP pyrophosphatase
LGCLRSSTIPGAINRAKNALKLIKSEDELFAIGLEGGLEMIDGIYFLICVAAIVDRLGRVATGKSEFLPLPRTVSDRILSGEQFGVAIREFEKTLDKEKGTDSYAQILELISREKSFSMAISLAYKAFCNL